MTVIQNEIRELLLSLGVSDVGFCHPMAGAGFGGSRPEREKRMGIFVTG